ncbi:MAG: hypothetical protein LBF39_05155 [Prevotellaceae bacterium]|jgi:hypothetical protein|nr:hypothetical protein [Prevotellaceae bacterium]
MGTTKKVKDFDCVEMKNAIQAQIYAETKDMSFKELKAYLFIPPEKDPFKKYKTSKV